MQNTLKLCLFSVAFAPVCVLAADFSAGVATAISQTVYKQHKTYVTPFPSLNYRGDRFFIEGKTAGVHIVKADQWTVSALIDVDFSQFDPDDSKNASFRQLDERKIGLLGGVKINYALSRNDVFSLSFLADISDHHQSVIPVLSWRHSYAFSDRTTRYFSFAEARFNSHKYNQYYYGVSRNESARSGVASYSPGAKAELSLGVGLSHSLTPTISVTALLGGRWIGNNLTDSPIIKRSIAANGFVGVSYRFE